MPIGIVGATLISAGVGAAASVYASSQQSKAAQAGFNLQQQQYQQTQGYLAPYRNIGNNALGSIAQLYGYGSPTASGTAGGAGGANGNALGAAAGGSSGASGAPNYSAFFNSPDYQFALQQGGLAVDRSAAARGLLTSGGTLKDLTSFGQGLASQQYGNYFNRLMSVAQLGSGAAGGSASASAAFGNAGAQSLNTLGAAQASGAVGVANSFASLPQNLLYAQAFGGSGGTNSPSSYTFQNGVPIGNAYPAYPTG
jgi:hypothetical protein